MSNRLIVERIYGDLNHVEQDECVNVNIYPDAFRDKDLTSIHIESIDMDSIYTDKAVLRRIDNVKTLINSRYGTNTLGIPKKIIFNGPATIVFWYDGTKTVVKQSENDIYDYEKGFAMCVMKKVFGENYAKARKMAEKAADNAVFPDDSVDVNTSKLMDFLFGKREY